MNEQHSAGSEETKCTPVRDCVNQCFHEGCQWKALQEENRLLRVRIARNREYARDLQKKLRALADTLNEVHT